MLIEPVFLFAPEMLTRESHGQKPPTNNNYATHRIFQQIQGSFACQIILHVWKDSAFL